MLVYYRHHPLQSVATIFDCIAVFHGTACRLERNRFTSASDESSLSLFTIAYAFFDSCNERTVTVFAITTVLKKFQMRDITKKKSNRYHMNIKLTAPPPHCKWLWYCWSSAPPPFPTFFCELSAHRSVQGWYCEACAACRCGLRFLPLFSSLVPDSFFRSTYRSYCPYRPSVFCTASDGTHKSCEPACLPVINLHWIPSGRCTGPALIRAKVHLWSAVLVWLREPFICVAYDPTRRHQCR